MKVYYKWATRKPSSQRKMQGIPYFACTTHAHKCAEGCGTATAASRITWVTLQLGMYRERSHLIMR